MGLTAQLQIGPPPSTAVTDGIQYETYGGDSGELMVDALHGRYYEAAARGNLFVAHATSAAPIIWTTAAGTGGPHLWNGSATHNVVIYAVTIALTVAATVTGALGLTGNTGQFAAPTTQTAITSRGCTLISGATSRATPYVKATPAAAGKYFMPLASVTTGAITTFPGLMSLIDIGGQIVCPPFCWVSVAASATLTTSSFAIGLVYEEVPI